MTRCPWRGPLNRQRGAVGLARSARRRAGGASRRCGCATAAPGRRYGPATPTGCGRGSRPRRSPEAGSQRRSARWSAGLQPRGAGGRARCRGPSPTGAISPASSRCRGITWGSARIGAAPGTGSTRDVAGRGIIPTALALAVDHCFFTVGLHRIEVNIRPENHASRRVVEKLGFREEGSAPRYLHIDGAWRDHLSLRAHRRRRPRWSDAPLARLPPVRLTFRSSGVRAPGPSRRNDHVHHAFRYITGVQAW